MDTGKLQESLGPLVYGSAGSGTGSLILLEVFMDCDTHTLITVATDRSFKLWDMASLARRNQRKGSDTGIGSSSKADGMTATTATLPDKEKEQSKSFFKFSSSPRRSRSLSVKDSRDRNKARGVCFIPCVGRIIPGVCLPPSLAKFVSCAMIDHPRYPFGTFAIVSKTNSIGIVQVMDDMTRAFLFLFDLFLFFSSLLFSIFDIKSLILYTFFSFHLYLP